MNHKLYFTPNKISAAEFVALRSAMLPINYDDLLDALGAARNANSRGGIAWLIESNDGSSLDRDQIVREIRHRGSALEGRPKKY